MHAFVLSSNRIHSLTRKSISLLLLKSWRKRRRPFPHVYNDVCRVLPVLRQHFLWYPTMPACSQASVHSLWSLCWCPWCCLLPTWSSRHWSPCRRLWRLCQDAQLNLSVLLPLLLSHQCHQQSGGWWLFCLQCWQCLHDLLRLWLTGLKAPTN